MELKIKQEDESDLPGNSASNIVHVAVSAFPLEDA